MSSIVSPTTAALVKPAFSTSALKPRAAKAGVQASKWRRAAVRSEANNGVESTPIVISSEALPVPPPAPKPFSFFNFMSFAGAGPEVINGRAAMLGIVTAYLVEASTGESVIQQIARHPAASLEFLVVVALVTLGSMVPVYKNLEGSKVAAGSPFQPKSEEINGRAAMIGFAALLITEAIKGSAVF